MFSNVKSFIGFQIVWLMALVLITALSETIGSAHASQIAPLGSSFETRMTRKLSENRQDRLIRGRDFGYVPLKTQCFRSHAHRPHSATPASITRTPK